MASALPQTIILLNHLGIIDYFPINTDLDYDYSYYTPNGAVVSAENSSISKMPVCGSIYNILENSSDTLFQTNMYFVFTLVSSVETLYGDVCCVSSLLEAAFATGQHTCTLPSPLLPRH